MSEQVDAHLQIPSSYDFKRNSVSHYRNHSIDSNSFHQWVKDNMYTSSYAKHHSPVLLSLLRNPLLLVPTTSQDTEASFPLIGLKVCMLRPLPTRPRRSLLSLRSISIGVVWRLRASTSPKMHSLINQKMPPAINTAKHKSNTLTPHGS